MTGKMFIDTNVLVYSRDTTEPVKQQQAGAWVGELWQSRQGTLSFQVLHEYYVTVTRKLIPGMGTDAARADVRALLAWDPVPSDASHLEAAWHTQDRFDVSWWDALIIAAAQTTNSRYLLTEDLQPDMCFDSLRVVNPFRIAYSELD